MILARQQKGMTLIGWLLTLGLIGFFVLLFLNIVPIYLEYFKVKRSWESFEKNTDGLYAMTNNQAYKALYRYLVVEEVDEKILEKDLVITRERDAKKFSLDHVREVQLLENLFVVGRFHFEFTKARGE